MKTNFSIRMLRIIPILMLPVLFAACEKDTQNLTKENAQQVLKPVIDEAKANGCTCDPVVNQYTYKGTTMYALIYTGPACNSIVTYYDENGRQLQTFAAISFDSFVAEADFIGQVWKCK